MNKHLSILLLFEDCAQLPECDPDPIDCEGAFTDFSECPVTCGTGQVTRVYNITNIGNGFGKKCAHGHGYTETALCDMGNNFV